jgi:hypothetical protein
MMMMFIEISHDIQLVRLSHSLSQCIQDCVGEEELLKF